MNKEEEERYLAEAKKMFDDFVDFKDFHNHFFAQGTGMLGGMEREERIRFIKTPLYKNVQKLEIQLGIAQGYLARSKETGEAEEREFSGEFRLRLAKSLHQELVVEAKRENVSLNQLCLIKLARPLNGQPGGPSAPAS